jgi:hypothetical protein
MTIKCACGAEYLEIEYWDDDEGAIYISHIIPSFYALQHDTWDRIKDALKIIWCLLRGKQYEFFSISLDTKSKIKEFKEFVEKIDANKAFYEE